MLLEEKLLLDFKYKEILANLYVDTVLKNLRTSLHRGKKPMQKFVIQFWYLHFLGSLSPIWQP